MKQFGGSFILFLMMIVVVIVNATPPSTSGTCSNNNNPVFGISKQGLGAALQLRGGELHEPSSVEEMDAIVLKAAAQGKLVVIDFTATWCGPCKMIAPLFKSLSNEMGGVVFVKVDVDDNPDTAAKYSVSAMPTFVFIKSGEVVDRLMGANPARLQAMIEDHM